MDTRDTKLHNLLFLLSAAPLSVGCVITDGDDSSDTESVATEAPTTTETPADTTDGGDIPAVCVTYGDTIALCYDEKSGAIAAQYCADAIANYEAYYGAECVTAFEDWLACLSALTCDELGGADPVCEAENAALETACVPK